MACSVLGRFHLNKVKRINSKKKIQLQSQYFSVINRMYATVGGWRGGGGGGKERIITDREILQAEKLMFPTFVYFLILFFLSVSLL